jgi:aspartyl-tRNA(Asn)/glutamyl-tRNA(Gln) amidotransferase subunit A
LVHAFRHGELSPVEVTRDVLAHIARWEPHLQATWALNAESALEAARASEARWLRQQPAGALDGVPATLKENIATRGLALPLGTAATELTPAVEDAPPAARLREDGAVLLCKTTMPDYGMLSSGLSSFHAQWGKLTRNPWDLSKNPGGSSAGAAAAAAAGYGPMHVGTDIGGSIRLPAAWCGVVGFKPSAGRVPIKPPYLGRVAGPITRSVADAALLMATLSRPDVRDATSLPYTPQDWNDLDRDPADGCAAAHRPAAGRRLGPAAGPGNRAAVERAAAWAAAAGAQIAPLAPFTTREMADGINLFWRTRSWLDISALPPQRQALVLPFIRDWVAAAAGFSAAQLFHGYSQFAALRDAAVAACEPFDFVLSPVAPGVAFAAEWAMPTNDPLRAMEHIGFTLPYNMSEQPAISVPIAHNSAGLPIGLQIIGHRHDDVGVLRMARAFELLRGTLAPWPRPPGS